MKRFSLRTAVIATVVAGILLGLYVRSASRQSNLELGERVMREGLPALDLELRAWKAAAPTDEERFAMLQLDSARLSISCTRETPFLNCMDYLHVTVDADFGGVNLNVITSRAAVFDDYLKGLKAAAQRENVGVRVQEESEYRTAVAAEAGR